MSRLLPQHITPFLCSAPLLTGTEHPVNALHTVAWAVPPILPYHQDRQLQTASFPPGPELSHEPTPRPNAVPALGSILTSPWLMVAFAHIANEHLAAAAGLWGISGCCYKGLLADNFKETCSENVFTIATSTCSVLKSVSHYHFSKRQILYIFYFFLNH